MNYFHAYISLIFVVKIIYIFLAATNVYLKSTKQDNILFSKKIVYCKEITELIFTILMAILLIYLFNPITSQSIVITGHTKTLLYLFGIVLLITTNWNKFLTPSPWFIDLQKIVGPTQ